MMPSRARLSCLLIVASLAAHAVGCASAPAAPATVKAGSMARFIGHGGLLYALNQRQLLVYEAIPDASPQQVHAAEIPADAETLFPYGELLFVGTRQGMLVYELKDPRVPKLIGTAQHVYSCDPVVVENGVAYVTLRAGSLCRGGLNALLVFDVTNPTAPVEIARRDMPSPHGLGVDGGLLFVADQTEGLLVLDVRDPKNPRPMAKVPSIAGYDVIANAGILYVIANDGLYQYRYGPDGIAPPEPISRIPVGAPPPAIAVEPAKP